MVHELISILAILATGGTSPGPLPKAQSGCRMLGFGIRTAPLLLLSRPDVRTDLNLNPMQIAGPRR